MLKNFHAVVYLIVIRIQELLHRLTCQFIYIPLFINICPSLSLSIGVSDLRHSHLRLTQTPNTLRQGVAHLSPRHITTIDV